MRYREGIVLLASLLTMGCVRTSSLNVDNMGTEGSGVTQTASLIALNVSNCDVKNFCQSDYSDGMEAYVKLNNFIDRIRASSNSTFGYYIGFPVQDDGSTFSAVRIFAILPSEYIRNTSAEWDSFEIVVGDLKVPGSESRVGFISVENYRSRRRSLFSGAMPSPDWEFTSPNSNEISNYRSKIISARLSSAIAE